MTYSLIDMLPYNKQHQITTLDGRIRILELTSFLCHISQKAIKNYLYGDYQLFDAQVSENLCQIRAYQLTLLLDNHQAVTKDITLLSVAINKIQPKIEAILAKFKEYRINKPSHYTKEIDQDITLTQLLDNYSLNFVITNETYFLIQAYLLSYYKIIDEHEISYGIDYGLLRNEIGINSKTFIRKFIHHLQKNISHSSCNFIFKLIDELGSEPNHSYLLHALYNKD